MALDARQFDVYRSVSGTLVVVIQSDLLDAMATRVVVPLMPLGMTGTPLTRLNPRIAFGDQTLVLVPQLAATLTIREIGERMGSVADQRDSITLAIDTLLAGV